MRAVNEPEVFEIGHDVAYRGGRQVEHFGQRTRADRLPVGNVTLYQHLQQCFCSIIHVSHVRASTRWRDPIIGSIIPSNGFAPPTSCISTPLPSLADTRTAASMRRCAISPIPYRPQAAR